MDQTVSALKLPNSLEFRTQFRAKDLLEASVFSIEKAIECGIDKKGKSKDYVLDIKSNLDSKTAMFTLFNGDVIFITRSSEFPGIYLVDISRYKVNDTEALTSFLLKSNDWLKKFVQKDELRSSVLRRVDGGGHFCPEPPIAEAHSHLIVTTKEEIEENYASPKAFYDAWDSIEEFNEKLLCTRALECANNLEFKRRVYPHQWAMARAAKPGLTRYGMAMPSPEEMDFFREGEPVLHDEGLYDPEQKIFEFECALGIHDTEQHIPPWQIFMVLDAVDTHQTPGGEPADTIRVAFAFEAMARREARVLLDIGAKVIYLNARAEDEEIMD
jgi:hypothetical protein